MINEYLTEKSLGDFLKERFVGWDIIENKSFIFKDITGISYRPDYQLVKGKTVIIVEYDGDRHYRDFKCTMDDLIKEKIFACDIRDCIKCEGCDSFIKFEYIRIPYFIQLNSEEIIKKIFGEYIEDYSSFNSYPHGFISEKVVLPMEFNMYGLKRFAGEMYGEFKEYREEIFDSIYKHKRSLFPDKIFREEFFEEIYRTEPEEIYNPCFECTKKCEDKECGCTEEDDCMSMCSDCEHYDGCL